MRRRCDTPSVTSAAVDDAALSPLQRKTLGLLRRAGEPVVFDPAFVATLQGDIEEAFELFAERLGDETVFISKHRMSSVLGCEVQHMLDDSFAWSPAVAGGQVAHRAIQLLVNWRGEPVPADVVDEAIARLADDDTSLGEWIAGLSEADRADLTGFAVDKVIKFIECFPPLDRRAAPTTESSVRWPLEGPIVLSGKVDLTIGRPSGAESRKVIVDLKTGWVSPKHREDLRFYALVETLRTQVPPRKLASFYLDAGQPIVEDVTEAGLLTASRRMLDAVNAEIELRVEGRQPVKRPGTSCRWCPIAPECPEGTAFMARRAADDDLDPDAWTAIRRAAIAGVVGRLRRRCAIGTRAAVDRPGMQGSGVIRATGKGRPASRTVAISLPGCTAGLGSPTRSGPSSAQVRSRFGVLTTSP